MIKKSILIWLTIIPLAILNGALRETLILPLLGEKYALPISGIILCILIFIVSIILIPKLGKGSTKTFVIIGLIWFTLTILFETTIGLSMGHSFKEIIKNYDFTTGNLWTLIVLFTAITPWLTAKIKHQII